MTSFRMIIPSNSSMNTIPDNKVNYYVTALSNRIELDGDWEVALSEILFQRTWYNIQEDECMLSIIMPGTETDMFLPEGFYSDGYQLIDRCNRMIERILKDAGTIVDTKFSYDATSRKISVHVGADNVVTLSSDPASIMGFSTREMTFSEDRKHKGKVAVDPNRRFNSLYVYCDAAEAIPVGSSSTCSGCCWKFRRHNLQIVCDVSVSSSLKERV